MAAYAFDSHIDGTLTLGTDPRHDLALDLAALDTAAAGSSVVRAYSWASPVVILGYNQPMDDVNVSFCRAQGMQVLRRGSGGRGIIHQGDLGVSLAIPMSHPWAKGIQSLNQGFTAAIAAALRELGYPLVAYSGSLSGEESPVCFEHQGSDGLYLGDRRVFGSAQVRRQRAALIHGTLLLEFDPDLHAAVFGVPMERLKSRITSLEASPHRTEIRDAVLHTLRARLNQTGDDLLEQSIESPAPPGELFAMIT